MEAMLEQGRAAKGMKKAIGKAAKEAGLKYHQQVIENMSKCVTKALPILLQNLKMLIWEV